MSCVPYRWLAKYYDHLFEYRGPFQEARRRVIERILPRTESACDLGCGTGISAIRYASRGIRTYAVDLSPDMCRVVRRKARRAGLRVRVVCADMRSFNLPESVDLVTSEADAINHVPRKSDLHRVLRGVARALKPRGHLLFDVNNRLAFERVWSNTWFFDKEPVALVLHGGHKPGTDRAWTDVEWFVQRGKSWRRFHEHVEEVCWSETEIREALVKAGFDRIRSWDAAPYFKDSVTLPGNRTFWYARKAE